MKRAPFAKRVGKNTAPYKRVRAAVDRVQVHNMRVAAPIPMKAQERNYVDLAATGYAADTTGTITLVATIAQGASVNQRIGKKCMIRSVQVRGTCANGTTGTYNKATMLLVYDRRPTGALPVVTDVLVSASSLSFPNDNNTGRFKTLLRRDYDLVGAPSATTGTESAALLIEEFCKVNKKAIFKAAGTGAIADIEEGAIYLITVGNTVAGTGAATINIGLRTRFTEF